MPKIGHYASCQVAAESVRCTQGGDHSSGEDQPDEGKQAYRPDQPRFFRYRRKNKIRDRHWYEKRTSNPDAASDDAAICNSKK